MQPNHAGHTSRSSLLALSMPQPHGGQDPISLTVAQELLNGPNEARRRSNLTTTSTQSHPFDGSDDDQQVAELSAEGHPEGISRRAGLSSNTWTSSSGDILSDRDEIDDRTFFVQEYNRLARKHGVRAIVPEEHEPNDESFVSSAKQGSWFTRKILRRTSSSQSVKLKNDGYLKHMRSISDSLRIKSKRDKLKDRDLQDLARLCGLSLVYLPTEYAAGSLAVPTCFRATAQFLIQHAPTTRGVFRIPGSQNAIASLYNHYCALDEEGEVIAGTVRCPTLPDHIRCDVHDVASAFKKFLAGLPGGILGSLALFNALVSIQTQFQGDAELTRTKQSKIRARLIALAVATLRSQYRRELICAVFGLLSMIGRAAETAPREDERGRPLPTSDLMGYGPLGIIFGPLLVGSLMEDYTMRIVNPHGGLVLLPISPPKSRKERAKKARSGDEGIAFNNQVDKVKVANGITEMLITHWRDVVRHMKNLSALKVVSGTQSLAVRSTNPPILRPSASETFAMRKPPDWDQFGSPIRRRERSISPTPNRRPSGALDILSDVEAPLHQAEMLKVKKQRSTANRRLSGKASKPILPPTLEESPKEASHQANSGISGAKQRSTTSNSSEDELVRRPQLSQESGKVLDEKVHSSNYASDKENKPLATKPLSMPKPGSQGLQYNDHKRHDHKQDSAEESEPVDEVRGIQDHAVAKRESGRSSRTGMKAVQTEADTTATTADNNSNTIPNKQNKQSPFIVRKDAWRSSGDTASSPRGRNKLTKSAERAQFKQSGSKANVPRGMNGNLIPTKRSKKDNDSAPRSQLLGNETGSQITLASVHDKFWPFDQMPGLDHPDSRNNKPANWEIRVTKTSSQDPDDKITVTPRRVGGSEPGLRPPCQSLRFRRGSKSLDGDSKLRGSVDFPRQPLSKDPLSRVSHEEDVASLAQLAQVLSSMDDLESLLKRSAGPDPRAPVLSLQTGMRERRSQSKISSSNTALSKAVASEEKTGTAKGSEQERHGLREQRNTSFKMKSTDYATAGFSPKTQPASLSKELKAPRADHHQNSATPAFNNSSIKAPQMTPRKRAGSSRSPSSKISALVAKYNNADAVPSPFPSGTTSPARSPTRTFQVQPQSKIEPPKDALVAPYTTNLPSPTRSQISGKSGSLEKTPQSRRTPEAAAQPLNPEGNKSPSKVPAPKRILRNSLDDFIPLRPAQKPIENAFPFPLSPSKSVKGSLKLQPSQKTLDGFALKIAGPPTPSERVDPTALLVQRLARSTSRTLTPPPVKRKSLEEVVTEIKGPWPSLLNPVILRSVRELTEISSEEVSHDASSPKPADPAYEVAPGVAGLDGSADELEIHPMFQPPRQRAPHIIRSSRSVSSDLPNFVHPDSPFRDAFSNPVSPVSSPPPGRSHSVLYTEIKRLQRQLSTKTEEAKQLKQQLDARQNLDLGSLSEGLREAKKEVQKWKARAKVAEKQLEILFKTPSRSMSTQLAYSSTPRLFSDRVDASIKDGTIDRPRASERLRKFFNGTDGAASSEESQNSTNTVVRDVQEVIIGSEYSMWVERTAKVLDAEESS